MNLTKEQQAAVDARGGTVLVSAAAGAGKTRVLVERLMTYIIRDGRNIDDFLVVTYTRAAAGEMRGRIMDRLREFAGEQPDDLHLHKQLTRIHTARIGTLDSYCREILLENAVQAGLPSGYRVGDAAEMELLQARILEETLDTLYERAENNPCDPFYICADTYGDERGDRILAGLILHIWQKTRCHADPAGWLQGAAASLSDTGLVWKDILFDQALCITDAFLRDYRRMSLTTDGPYGETLRQDLVQMELLHGLLCQGEWNASASFLENFAFERLKSDPEGNPAFKALRDQWKKTVNERLRLWIYGSMESHLTDSAGQAPVLAGLREAVCAFDEALTAEKLRLAVLEFSDVERIVLSLLAPNGEPTPLAKTLSERFTEILVDEYQDINPLQDAILTALSRDGSNLFYVGDARQSIYRFQMAEPRYFLEKLHDEIGSLQKVILSKNFRSKKPILDAVNHLFSHIECPESGVLTQEFFMRTGNEDEQAGGTPVELLITGGYSAEREAEQIARRLRILTGSGEALPGDCVILMRSPQNRLSIYRKALEREGLSAAVPSGEGYFVRPEIKALVSALEIIDNARLDIALLSVLRSPIVGCSADELADLRLLSDGALCECLPLSENKKLISFHNILRTWRAAAADLPPYALAARILADTGLTEKVSPSARANLLYIPELLRGFAGELRALPDWLRAQKDTGNAIAAGFSSSPGFEEDSSLHGGGSVRIMSIHSSKGLEFPVVVVADLEKRINLQDQHNRLLAHPRLGLGLKHRDAYSEYPTPAYRAVQAVMDSETRSEELRLLYVAMTRAQKRLILSCGSLPEDTPSGVSRGDLILRPSVAAWVFKARDLSWKAAGDLPSEEPPEKSACPAAPQPEKTVLPPVSESGWQYPYPEAAETPSKLTATGLKGRFPDEWAMEGAADMTASRLPRPSAQARGSAMHLFLQFCDYICCSRPGGTEGEVRRLLEQGLLTPEQAESVDTQAIRLFFGSPRGKELLSAKGLRREQKFSLLVQNGDIPGLVLPEGEKVLLQGVIDCFYETPEGMVLLDFKTDRLRSGEEEARALRYKSQMDAYAFALAAMTGKPVCGRYVVFLATQQEASV